MEKRRRQRIPKRMTCEIEAGEVRAAGIIRDLSEKGLFVQTHLNVQPDSLVELILPAAEGTTALRIEAGVARKRVIPRRLQTSVPAGLGLEVIPPGDDFNRLVAGLKMRIPRTEPTDSDRTPDRQDAIRAFRFRMIRNDRKGAPRLLTIRCETEASARARALARAGAGWKIADVQRL